MTDLYSNLFKWAHRQDENFLTEAFAFILNRLLTAQPESGRKFVAWLCFGTDEQDRFPGPLKVSTQITVEEGRPDIWVTAPGLIAFVEVKKESDLGDGQLQRYRKHLSGRSELVKGLVLLTRYRVEVPPPPEGPDRRVRWSEVANQLRGFGPTDPVTDYLIEQFLEFLRRQVMSVERVGWEYVAGVTAQRRLLAMLAKALELANVGVHRASAGWDEVGYYIEGKKFWIGTEYAHPHLLFLSFADAKPDIERLKATGRVQFDSKGKPYLPFDLTSEGTCFLARSADAQLALLADFVREACQIARDCSDVPQEPPPASPPP